MVNYRPIKRLSYLSGCGAPTDVKEIRRRSPVDGDDVHSGHGEAGAVHHTTDAAVRGKPS